MTHRKRLFVITLILLVFLLCLCGCSKERVTQEIETTAIGIDVAKYQGIIDWQQVADSDIDFAFVRVGYRTIADGQLREDPSARYNLQEASKAGISLGVYFFSTAVTEEEALEEARWVASFVAKYPITYPVVYDCEGYSDPESRQYSLTKRERTDIALAFLEEVQRLGYEGMFYSSRNEMYNENQWEVSRIEENFKIWVAQYPDQPYPSTPESSYFGTHHMWQYSTEGSVPGIEENVDMNVAYFGYDGIEPPKDSKAPEEVLPDLETFMDFQETDEMVTAKVETNLRNIPSQGDDSHILFTLKNGEYAHRIAVSNSGWSKLEYEGLVCYAVSSYLTTDAQASSASAVPENHDGISTQFSPVNYQVTAKDKVNLRTIPSVEREDSQVIAQLKKGDTATCIGVSDNGWAKLDYKGTICYAVNSYLVKVAGDSDEPAPTEQHSSDTNEVETKFEEINDRVTPKVEVNLRRLPSVEDPRAVVVASIKNGEIVQRTGINRDVGWSRVIYNGEVLYCVSSYVKVVSE